METTTAVATDQATLLLIEEEVRHLIGLMGFSSAQVHSRQDETGQLIIALEVEDGSRLLIGPHGTHLQALEHVLRALIRRRLAASVAVMVDVNRYRAHRQQKLLAEAEAAAAETQRTGRPIVLAPMSAADRRIIHTAFANHPTVRTESIGQEPSRRVVIRPVAFSS